jgi:hypothetical protein
MLCLQCISSQVGRMTWCDSEDTSLILCRVIFKCTFLLCLSQADCNLLLHSAQSLHSSNRASGYPVHLHFFFEATSDAPSLVGRALRRSKTAGLRNLKKPTHASMLEVSLSQICFDHNACNDYDPH